MTILSTPIGSDTIFTYCLNDAQYIDHNLPVDRP